MINIEKLSTRYAVRRITKEEIASVLKLYRDNEHFFRYCHEKPTREQVLKDMLIVPPGTAQEDKYFVGFYLEEELIAVMDLIDGYPNADTAYIGLFMLKRAFQGQQRGTAIMRECEAYLKSVGKKAIRLAINKGNAQAELFWHKNGFRVLREVERNGRKLFVAEKAL